MTVTLAELERRFVYHKPDESKKQFHETIRAMGHEFAFKELEFCPDCRERSLAITKIEEAVMWANAAIARNV